MVIDSSHYSKCYNWLLNPSVKSLVPWNSTIRQYHRPSGGGIVWLTLAWTRTWPQVDGGTLLSLALPLGSRGERRVYSIMMRCLTRELKKRHHLIMDLRSMSQIKPYLFRVTVLGLGCLTYSIIVTES